MSKPSLKSYYRLGRQQQQLQELRQTHTGPFLQQMTRTKKTSTPAVTPKMFHGVLRRKGKDKRLLSALGIVQTLTLTLKQKRTLTGGQAGRQTRARSDRRARAHTHTHTHTHARARAHSLTHTHTHSRARFYTLLYKFLMDAFMLQFFFFFFFFIGI